MMQRYPAYKDSGFDWLGEIPAHWKAIRLKFVTRILYGQSLTNEDRKNKEVPVYGSNGIVGYHDSAISKAPCIIIGRKGSFGKINFSGLDCYPIDTTFYVDPSATKHNIRWLYYVLLSLRLDAFTKDSAVPGLNREEIYEKYVPLPPLADQKLLVDFLDEQTAVINQFLTNKRRLIELLEEQKQVVIHTAVTQGLDTAVARKPSDIDWLGDIPAHWEEIKLKHLSEFIQTGPFGSQLHAHDYVDNGTPVINPIHLQNGRIIPDLSITVDNETLQRLERHQLEIGDIILARCGELGRCAVVNSESAGWLCGTGSMNLRPKPEKVFSPYLAQIIQSEKVKTWLTTESVGSTMDNLNGSILGNLRVPIPPIQEQQQIIYSCQEREAEINAAIERSQREIELIEEYRTTLIAHAVTGKIDVRSVV